MLDTAKRIAYQEGISSLNIRRVASESGIAIGTVYNYYPAKSDLILAVMEDFWRNVFHGNEFNTESTDFVESFAQIFRNLSSNLDRFETIFLKEAALFNREEKLKGKNLEITYLNHMKSGMTRILDLDTNVSGKIWSDRFTRHQFIDFAFSNLIVLLQSGKKDCSFLQQILSRILYERE